MNAIRTTFWLVALNTAVALSRQGQAVAGVTLQSGTTIEFATVQQGREVLTNRDEFIQMMSQLDRCVLMQTSAAVTEAQFLAYVQNQVQTWTAAEQTKFSNIIVGIQAPLASLNLSLPETILLIKTTGNEIGNAAYVRGSSVILPTSIVSATYDKAAQVLTHELFHVYTWYNPQLRGALYQTLGVRLCNEIPFPPWLLPRRMATPNPVPWDFMMRVQIAGESTPVVPMYLYNATNYTGGSLANYLTWKLLVLQETPDGFRASCFTNGQPILFDHNAGTVSDFFDQIGRNTTYNIHPEETLAENFMQIVLGNKHVSSPRIHYLLRRVLAGSASQWPAGRFTAELALPDGEPRLLETSRDFQNWRVCAALTNRSGGVEVRDPRAWLGGNRFFRVRTGELPFLAPGDTNNLVWIPPGTFLMGSPTNEAGRTGNAAEGTAEGPQRTVTFTRGFWMGRFEVTQAEYQQVMGANPSSFRGLSNRPVDSVTWTEAANYCVRLTQQQQTAGRLPSAYAYRLPTEAEWEYAARGGTTNRFSYGEDPDYHDCYEQMWFADNAGSRPNPVGLTPPNPWGLHDLHGNVWEWCRDWSGTYSGSAVTDPQGPPSGIARILRGGNWSRSPAMCRSAARFNALPELRLNQIGFRVVLASTAP